jgi:hypothetical protein
MYYSKNKASNQVLKPFQNKVFVTISQIMGMNFLKFPRVEKYSGIKFCNSLAEF